jgi:hypothetical protein
MILVLNTILGVIGPNCPRYCEDSNNTKTNSHGGTLLRRCCRHIPRSRGCIGSELAPLRLWTLEGDKPLTVCKLDFT